MYFREIIAVHSENNMEHVNTPCETSIEHSGIVYIKVLFHISGNTIYKKYTVDLFI
jgi:hypothetical protein